MNPDFPCSKHAADALRRAIVLLLSLLVAPAANACTLCHTADAEQLRHAVFEHGFTHNLLLISVVFPLLLGAIYLAGMELPSAGNDDEYP